MLCINALSVQKILCFKLNLFVVTAGKKKSALHCVTDVDVQVCYLYLCALQNIAIQHHY